MKRIGVLFGMENTFPGALVDRVNAMCLPDVQAELAQVGAVRMDEPCAYAVIVDRISHDIPFYRAWLKTAVLAGATVINNPFWCSADDKFFNYALAARIGVAVPPTVILPHKEHPPGTTDRSMRNLQYPIDWDAVFAHVGFPAYMKPFDGGGWRDVYLVTDPDGFFRAYDQTRTLCMTLQRAVDFTEYFRCYVVGREKVHIMPYEPRASFHERYVKDPPPSDPAVLARVERDAIALCWALGYDLNAVEFAVAQGVPYAIDFLNPTPEADVHTVGQGNFDWLVGAVAELVVARAVAPSRPREYRWDEFLGG